MFRDKILSAKLKVSPVVVQEWGDGPFYVRSLTGADYAKMRNMVHKLPADTAAIVGEIWLALFALCDEAGNRILKDDDYETFSQQPVTAITTVVKAAMLNNGLGTEGLDAAKNG